MDAQQRRMTSALKDHITSLRENYRLLLRSATIGPSHEEEPDMDDEDGDMRRVADDISDKTYAALSSDVTRKNLGVDVASQSIVHSCESLLDLISELKMIYILDAHKRDGEISEPKEEGARADLLALSIPDALKALARDRGVDLR